MQNKNSYKPRPTTDETDGRILPRSIEAEQKVLGGIIGNSHLFAEVIETLSEESFYDDSNKAIFRAIKKIAEQGDTVDGTTVMNELRKDNTFDVNAYLAVINESHISQVHDYVKILIEKEKRRKFFEVGAYLTTNAFSESEDVTDVTEAARKMIDGIQEDITENIFLVKDAIANVFNQMTDNLRDGTKEITGTPTGLKDFDRKGGGLQKSDLIIIAAETSQGKTSLALTIARNAALSGTKLAFYSLEMQKEQLAARLMAMESGVPSNNILYSRLQPYQFERIDKTIRAIYNAKIFFDERSTSNIDKILSSIRSLVIKYGIEGAFVDYLQILSVNTKNASPEQQMGEVARRLKNLAKELNIWIVALSQLNRNEQNPVPTINRLRSSGQIAEAADVVMLIYRPEQYEKQYPAPHNNRPTKGTAMIDIAKGRNIGLLKFICAFNSETSHFTNLDEKIIVSDKNEPHDEETPF